MNAFAASSRESTKKPRDALIVQKKESVGRDVCIRDWYNVNSQG
jgi:hypothetical protein